jgi:hypothetical protein
MGEPNLTTNLQNFTNKFETIFLLVLERSTEVVINVMKIPGKTEQVQISGRIAQWCARHIQFWDAWFNLNQCRLSLIWGCQYLAITE